MAPERDQDVFDEPWMKPVPPRPAGTPPPLPDEHALPDQYDISGADETDMEQILHSISNEPHVAGSIDPAETELAQLIRHHRRGSTSIGLFAVVLLVAIVAGPLSVVGTLAAGRQGVFGLLYLVAGGPVIEEMMKLGGLLFLLEKRPWYITRGWHIVVAACLSALLFGIIENLVYGGVYLSGLSGVHRSNVMEFRWTVTVLLHTATTFIGAIGLRKAWQATIAHGRLFDSQIAEPFIAAAVIIHGSYNALALIFGSKLLEN